MVSKCFVALTLISTTATLIFFAIQNRELGVLKQANGPSFQDEKGSFFKQNLKIVSNIEQVCSSEKWALSALDHARLVEDWDSGNSTSLTDLPGPRGRRKRLAGASLIASEKYKLLYCLNLKAGSSNFRKFITDVNVAGTGLQNVTPISNRLDDRRHLGLFHLSSVATRLELETILNTYTIVALVRNPFIRLMSAWHMASRLGVPLTVGNSSWSHDELANFYRYIIDENSGKIKDIDRHPLYLHWSRQSDRCSVCHIKYDYIAKVETMNRDLTFILGANELFSKLGLPVPTVREQPAAQRGLTAAEYYREAGNVPRQLVEDLLNVYALDYELFDYNMTADLERIFEK